MRLQSLVTAGATLSLIGLLLGPARKAEALQLSRVTDINPSIGYFSPRNLTVFDNALYFSAEDFLNGRELWKYDGITTSLVADINPGYSSSDLNGFTVFENALYFSADDGVHGQELWKYDGTTASLVADLIPTSVYFGSFPSNLTVFDNSLYFSAEFRDNDGSIRRKLWKYDGTTASLVSEFLLAGGSNPGDLTVFDNALYFRAEDVNGFELWKYDGTTASLVADINPGRTDSFPLSSFPSDLTVFENALYFSADDGVSGFELWKYDGTTASLVADINPGSVSFGLLSSLPEFLTVFNNVLYFRANDGVHSNELWKYDGTIASLVADIYPGSDNSGSFGSFPAGFSVFENALYFQALDSVNGIELWQYDGTTASLVADIYPGSGSSAPFGFTVFNNALYFSADDGVNGQQLWKLELDEPTSVPEPTSALGLLAFGAVGATSVLKRKLQKSA